MSSTITTMPESIVNWLKNISDLRHITFMTEYPPQAKAVPLRNSIVSVGLAEVKITDLFHENEDGELIRDEYCRQADIHIVLGIHVPDSLGGSTCHDVFSTIVNYLTFSTDLNIISSTCGHVTSDRNTESLVMDADIHIGAEFCPADETGLAFNSFASKTFFCKNHMEDTVLHLNEGEREKWDNPCYVGAYTGSGSGSRTINLDFTPRFVFAYAVGGGALSIDFDEKEAKMYFGYATEGNSSSAIECTTKGFRVHNGENYKSGNTYPLLNETGYNYVFYAVK
ncbi:MAG: hypothetical protein E7555_05765 [Ruminococcaceae bacterium]|nr:hypothetical protein [Oscillospiraceae bacterium]